MSNFWKSLFGKTVKFNALVDRDLIDRDIGEIDTVKNVEFRDFDGENLVYVTFGSESTEWCFMPDIQQWPPCFEVVEDEALTKEDIGILKDLVKNWPVIVTEEMAKNLLKKLDPLVPKM